MNINARMKKSDLIDLLVQLMAALSFFLLIFMKIDEKIKIICEPLLIILGTIILLRYFIKNHDKDKLLCMIVVVSILATSNMLFIGAMTIKILIKTVLVHLPIVLAVIKCNRKFPEIWKWLFWLLSVFLLYRLLFVDYYRIFADTSSNMVSIYMIIVLFLYEYQRSNNLQKIVVPEIEYTITIFILSIISQGRMGIASSFVLFILGVYVRYFIRNDDNKKYNLLKRIIVTASLFFVVCYIGYNISDVSTKYFIRFTQSYSYDTESSNMIRMMFLQDYIKGCENIINLFFGLNFAETSHLAELEGGNVHNSYLMIHSYLGICGIGLFIICTYKVAKKLFYKKQFGLLIILFVFLLRIFTDYCMPGNIGDVLAFCIVILSTYTHNKRGLT